MAVTQQQAIEELQRRTQQPDTLGKIAESAPIQAVLGAGDIARSNILEALRRAEPDITGLTIKGIPLAPQKQLVTTPIQQFRPVGEPGRPAYKVGAALGDIGSYWAAGAAGGAGLADLPESALARILQAAPGRIAGAGLFGQAVSPDRLKGGFLGVGIGAGAEAIPAGIAAIRKFTNPNVAKDVIMNYLSGGKSLEENKKAFADSVQNAYNKNEENNNALYNPIFDRVGNRSVYNPKLNPPEYYKNINPSIIDSYLQDTKDLHDNFMQKPTIDNAHRLQSQLGYDSRRFAESNEPANVDFSQKMAKAQQALKNDIDMRLFNEDKTGDLADLYTNASEDFIQNVLPYRQNKDIYGLAKGTLKKSPNITNLFANPTLPGREYLLKIANDIGPKGNKQIIYSEIGKRLKMTPEKLTDEFNALDKKGLSYYKTPTMDDLLSKMSRAKIGQKALEAGVGFGAGVAALPLVHSPTFLSELAGGGAAAALSPVFMGALRAPTAIAAKGIEKAFPVARGATLGAILGQPVSQSNLQQRALAELLKRQKEQQ